MVQGKTSWLASNKDKRRGELFFLFWSAVWMSLMALIVATEAFEWFQPMHYMAVGVVIMAPCVLLPLILHRDSELHWYDRYTTKANIWCAIMAFVANYLWTHYFYKVLGASYTFKAHRLNDVPFALYLISHSYFISYHTFATIILRKAGFLKHDTAQWTQPLFIGLLSAMAYFVAYMETFTIQNDANAMYIYGSGFYALYFIVSFPMFARIDEWPNLLPKFSLSQSAIDSFGACMIITLLLDFWRLSIGPIFQNTIKQDDVQVPFIY